MGAKESKIRGRIENLESQLSSTQAALSSTQAALSSTQATLSSTEATLSSTRASLRASTEEAHKLKEEKLGRDITLMKLIKVVELEEQVSSTKVEALLSKFNLETLEKEVETLKGELLAREKLEEDLEMKLKKVIEIESQVFSMMIDVSSTKDSLKASIKEENTLKEQLATQEKFQNDMEMKLQVIMKLENQLLDTKMEARSTKCELEASKKEEKTLEEDLLACEKFHQDLEMKLHNLMDLEKQLLFTKAEGLFVKTSLEASKKKEEELCKQLSAIEMYQNDMQMKLLKVLELEKEICSTETEALSTMASLEASRKTVEELREKLLAYEKVEQAVQELKFIQLN